jgi:hypothetical protein
MWPLPTRGSPPAANFGRARPGSTPGRRERLAWVDWWDLPGRRWFRRAPAAGQIGCARRGSDWPVVAHPAGAQAAEVAFEGAREGVGAVGWPQFGARGEFVAALPMDCSGGQEGGSVRETGRGSLGACGCCAFARGRARGVRAGMLAIRRPCVAAHAPDVCLGAPAHGAWLCPPSLVGWARRTVKTARRRVRRRARSTTMFSRRPYTGDRTTRRMAKPTPRRARALTRRRRHSALFSNPFTPLRKCITLESDN